MTQIEEFSPAQTRELIGHLRQFVTPERFQRFQSTLRHRTRHLSIILEDIFQPHNASAVLRTCDCFGIQDVHIIENRNRYQVNPDVALGASKWLTLHRYHTDTGNTKSCIESLRSRGYRIVATTPHENGYTLDQLPVTGKTALMFGTELEGLTQEALKLADAFVKIPMVGFTESLNISVSAAIFIQNLTTRLWNSEVNWHLTADEEEGILLHWLRESVSHSDTIITRFIGQKEHL